MIICYRSHLLWEPGNSVDQLRLVVYPIIFKVLPPSNRWLFLDFWTINSIMLNNTCGLDGWTCQYVWCMCVYNCIYISIYIYVHHMIRMCMYILYIVYTVQVLCCCVFYYSSSFGFGKSPLNRIFGIVCAFLPTFSRKSKSTSMVCIIGPGLTAAYCRVKRYICLNYAGRRCPFLPSISW